MSPRDRFVELLNLDAEIKQVRGWLASPKSMPRPWQSGALGLQAELAWLEQRREQVIQTLQERGRFVHHLTPSAPGVHSDGFMR